MRKKYRQIKYKGLSFCTNGNINPSNKVNIYFCCHSNDFNIYFETIKNEIWIMFPEVAFWYSNQRDETIFSELLLADMHQMDLIIILITKRFIEETNIAKTLILPYAIKNHICILPLLLEDGIEDEFNNSCGNLQYVKRLDDTYGYIALLKKYLDSILLNKKIQEKIKSEFSLRLFISYRKKDKNYINRIQRIIHSETNLNDVAIWYDDYLIPGESFNNNLSKMIEQCDAFIILITPNLLEENNYVMNYEYPLAIRLGKKIIPIQVVETNRDKLSYYYKNIPNPINLLEIDSFTKVIQSTGIQLNTNVKNSPQHMYLIGSAYLNGFEVEINFDKAISLISEAANKGYIDAYKKLISIYHNGYFTPKNPNMAIYWEEQYIEYILTQHNISDLFEVLYHSEDNDNEYNPFTVFQISRDDNTPSYYLLEVFHYLKEIGYTYYEMQEYDKALNNYELAFLIADFLVKKTGNTIDSDTKIGWQCLSDISLRKGQTYEHLGLLIKAEIYFKKSLKIDIELDKNEETSSHETLKNLDV